MARATALDVKGSEIVDLREREHYFSFHVPNARHASVTELTMQPGMRNTPFLVYGSGHFHADALQLCARLHHAGLRQARVVDGGIAAWAQAHKLPERLALSRLQDTEIAAALGEPSSQVTTLSQSIQLAAYKPHSAKATRRIILASSNTPLSAIQAELTKDTVTFYWIGSAERLHALLEKHSAQEHKRLDGHGVRDTCSAL